MGLKIKDKSIKTKVKGSMFKAQSSMSPEIMNYLFLSLSLNFEVEVEIKVKDKSRSEAKTQSEAWG